MRMFKAFMVAALVVAVSAGGASAQTSWQADGGEYDGNWTDTNHWTNGVPLYNAAQFQCSQDPAYTVTMDTSSICSFFELYTDKVNLDLGSNTLLNYGMFIGVDETDVAVLNISSDALDPDTPDITAYGRVYVASAPAGSLAVPDEGTMNLTDVYFYSTKKVLVGGIESEDTWGGKGALNLNHAKMKIRNLYAGLNTPDRAYVNIENGSIFEITGRSDTPSDPILIGGGDLTGHPFWTITPDADSGMATVVIDDSTFISSGTGTGFCISEGPAPDAGDESYLTLQNNATWTQLGTAVCQNVVAQRGTGTLELKSGSTMNLACQLFVGGDLDIAHGGAQNTVPDSTYDPPHNYPPEHPGVCNDGTGTVIINTGTSITIEDTGGSPEPVPPATATSYWDIVVFNNNSTINMNGGTLTNKIGSLFMTGGASGSNGTLNFQFSNPDHGKVVIEGTGQTADITKIGDAPLGFSFLGGGNTFVPTVAGCMDFIVAETITGFLTNAADAAYDNMDELLAAANGGVGYPSYAYGIVTIDSDDYVGGAYDGYKALRLSVLPADADLGGLCDGADLLTWQNGYTNGDTTWDKGDYNLSGLVDGPDLLIWQNNYGKTLGDCSGMGATGAAAAVPEPATLCLLGLGAVALIRRRR